MTDRIVVVGAASSARPRPASQPAREPVSDPAEAGAVGYGPPVAAQASCGCTAQPRLGRFRGLDGRAPALRRPGPRPARALRVPGRGRAHLLHHPGAGAGVRGVRRPPPRRRPGHGAHRRRRGPPPGRSDPPRRARRQLLRQRRPDQHADRRRRARRRRWAEADIRKASPSPLARAGDRVVGVGRTPDDQGRMVVIATSVDPRLLAARTSRCPWAWSLRCWHVPARSTSTRGLRTARPSSTACSGTCPRGTSPRSSP